MVLQPKSLAVTGAIAISIIIVFNVQQAHAAPLQSSSPGKTNLDRGCYYMMQHYKNGERIDTNEPCLNCTCSNNALMCYLRICPFVKPIGEDCIIERHVGDCCPKFWCPETYPVSTTPSPEGVGCYVDGRYYHEGSRIPSNPGKPCEACYCVRNSSVCTMQECELKVDGCVPEFGPGTCCPSRYNCSETAATTLPPGILESEDHEGCELGGIMYADGEQVPSVDPCEHCYCMKHEVVCAVQECKPPRDDCVAGQPRAGQCCPENYECPSTESPFFGGSTTRPVLPRSEDDRTSTIAPLTGPGEGTNVTSDLFYRGGTAANVTDATDSTRGLTGDTSETPLKPREPKITDVPDHAMVTSPFDRNTTARPVFFPSKHIPGEGVCRHMNSTYMSGEMVPSNDPCRENCSCNHSVVQCDAMECTLIRPSGFASCKAVRDKGQCCPRFECVTAADSDRGETTKTTFEATRTTTRVPIGEHVQLVQTELPSFDELATRTTASTFQTEIKVTFAPSGEITSTISDTSSESGATEILKSTTQVLEQRTDIVTTTPKSSESTTKVSQVSQQVMLDIDVTTERSTTVSASSIPETELPVEQKTVKVTSTSSTTVQPTTSSMASSTIRQEVMQEQVTLPHEVSQATAVESTEATVTELPRTDEKTRVPAAIDTTREVSVTESAKPSSPVESTPSTLDSSTLLEAEKSTATASEPAKSTAPSSEAMTTGVSDELPATVTVEELGTEATDKSEVPEELTSDGTTTLATDIISKHTEKEETETGTSVEAEPTSSSTTEAGKVELLAITREPSATESVPPTKASQEELLDSTQSSPKVGTTELTADGTTGTTPSELSTAEAVSQEQTAAAELTSTPVEGASKSTPESVSETEQITKDSGRTSTVSTHKTIEEVTESILTTNVPDEVTEITELEHRTTASEPEEIETETTPAQVSERVFTVHDQTTVTETTSAVEQTAPSTISVTAIEETSTGEPRSSTISTEGISATDGIKAEPETSSSAEASTQARTTTTAAAEAGRTSPSEGVLSTTRETSIDVQPETAIPEQISTKMEDKPVAETEKATTLQPLSTSTIPTVSSLSSTAPSGIQGRKPITPEESTATVHTSSAPEETTTVKTDETGEPTEPSIATEKSETSSIASELSSDESAQEASTPPSTQTESEISASPEITVKTTPMPLDEDSSVKPTEKTSPSGTMDLKTTEEFTIAVSSETPEGVSAKDEISEKSTMLPEEEVSEQRPSTTTTKEDIEPVPETTEKQPFTESDLSSTKTPESISVPISTETSRSSVVTESTPEITSVRQTTEASKETAAISVSTVRLADVTVTQSSTEKEVSTEEDLESSAGITERVPLVSQSTEAADEATEAPVTESKTAVHTSSPGTVSSFTERSTTRTTAEMTTEREGPEVVSVVEVTEEEEAGRSSESPDEKLDLATHTDSVSITTIVDSGATVGSPESHVKLTDSPTSEATVATSEEDASTSQSLVPETSTEMLTEPASAVTRAGETTEKPVSKSTTSEDTLADTVLTTRRQDTEPEILAVDHTESTTSRTNFTTKPTEVPSVSVQEEEIASTESSAITAKHETAEETRATEGDIAGTTQSTELPPEVPDTKPEGISVATMTLGKSDTSSNEIETTEEIATTEKLTSPTTTVVTTASTSRAPTTADTSATDVVPRRQEPTTLAEDAERTEETATESKTEKAETLTSESEASSTRPEITTFQKITTKEIITTQAEEEGKTEGAPTTPVTEKPEVTTTSQSFTRIREATTLAEDEEKTEETVTKSETEVTEKSTIEAESSSVRFETTTTSPPVTEPEDLLVSSRQTDEATEGTKREKQTVTTAAVSAQVTDFTGATSPVEEPTTTEPSLLLKDATTSIKETEGTTAEPTSLKETTSSEMPPSAASAVSESESESTQVSLEQTSTRFAPEVSTEAAVVARTSTTESTLQEKLTTEPEDKTVPEAQTSEQVITERDTSIISSTTTVSTDEFQTSTLPKTEQPVPITSAKPDDGQAKMTVTAELEEETTETTEQPEIPSTASETTPSTPLPASSELPESLNDTHEMTSTDVRDRTTFTIADISRTSVEDLSGTVTDTKKPEEEETLEDHTLSSTRQTTSSAESSSKTDVTPTLGSTVATSTEPEQVFVTEETRKGTSGSSLDRVTEPEETLSSTTEKQAASEILETSQADSTTPHIEADESTKARTTLLPHSATTETVVTTSPKILEPFDKTTFPSTTEETGSTEISKTTEVAKETTPETAQDAKTSESERTEPVASSEAASFHHTQTTESLEVSSESLEVSKEGTTVSKPDVVPTEITERGDSETTESAMTSLPPVIRTSAETERPSEGTQKIVDVSTLEPTLPTSRSEAELTTSSIPSSTRDASQEITEREEVSVQSTEVPEASSEETTSFASTKIEFVSSTTTEETTLGKTSTPESAITESTKGPSESQAPVTDTKLHLSTQSDEMQTEEPEVSPDLTSTSAKTETVTDRDEDRVTSSISVAQTQTKSETLPEISMSTESSSTSAEQTEKTQSSLAEVTTIQSTEKATVTLTEKEMSVTAAVTKDQSDVESSEATMRQETDSATTSSKEESISSTESTTSLLVETSVSTEPKSTITEKTSESTTTHISIGSSTILPGTMPVDLATGTGKPTDLSIKDEHTEADISSEKVSVPLSPPTEPGLPATTTSSSIKDEVSDEVSTAKEIITETSGVVDLRPTTLIESTSVTETDTQHRTTTETTSVTEQETSSTGISSEADRRIDEDTSTTGIHVVDETGSTLAEEEHISSVSDSERSTKISTISTSETISSAVESTSPSISTEEKVHLVTMDQQTTSQQPVALGTTAIPSTGMEPVSETLSEGISSFTDVDITAKSTSVAEKEETDATLFTSVAEHSGKTSIAPSVAEFTTKAIEAETESTGLGSAEAVDETETPLPELKTTTGRVSVFETEIPSDTIDETDSAGLTSSTQLPERVTVGTSRFDETLTPLLPKKAVTTEQTTLKIQTTEPVSTRETTTSISEEASTATTGGTSTAAARETSTEAARETSTEAARETSTAIAGQTSTTIAEAISRETTPETSTTISAEASTSFAPDVDESSKAATTITPVSRTPVETESRPATSVTEMEEKFTDERVSTEPDEHRTSPFMVTKGVDLTESTPESTIQPELAAAEKEQIDISTTANVSFTESSTHTPVTEMPKKVTTLTEAETTDKTTTSEEPIEDKSETSSEVSETTIGRITAPDFTTPTKSDSVEITTPSFVREATDTVTSSESTLAETIAPGIIARASPPTTSTKASTVVESTSPVTTSAPQQTSSEIVDDLSSATTGAEVIDEEATATPESESDCTVNGTVYMDGELVLSIDLCEECHCAVGQVVCLRQICKSPSEGCVPRSGQETRCCPVAFDCPIKTSTTGMPTTEATTHSPAMMTVILTTEEAADFTTRILSKDETTASPAVTEIATLAPHKEGVSKKDATEVAGISSTPEHLMTTETLLPKRGDVTDEKEVTSTSQTTPISSTTTTMTVTPSTSGTELPVTETSPKLSPHTTPEGVGDIQTTSDHKIETPGTEEVPAETEISRLTTAQVTHIVTDLPEITIRVTDVTPSSTVTESSTDLTASTASSTITHSSKVTSPFTLEESTSSEQQTKDGQSIVERKRPTIPPVIDESTTAETTPTPSAIPKNLTAAETAGPVTKTETPVFTDAVFTFVTSRSTDFVKSTSVRFEDVTSETDFIPTSKPTVSTESLAEEEERKTTKSVVEDQKTTESAVEDQKTTESVVEDQKATESAVEDQKTTESVMEDQKTTESVVEDQKTTESAVEDQKTTESAVEDQKTTESVMEDQKTTEHAVEDQKTTESAVEDQNTTESVVEDQKTTESVVEDQKTTESVVEDQKTTESAVEDQKTTESAVENQKTTEFISFTSPEDKVVKLITTTLRSVTGTSLEPTTATTPTSAKLPTSSTEPTVEFSKATFEESDQKTVTPVADQGTETHHVETPEAITRAPATFPTFDLIHKKEETSEQPKETTITTTFIAKTSASESVPSTTARSVESTTRIMETRKPEEKFTTKLAPEFVVSSETTLTEADIQDKATTTEASESTSSVSSTKLENISTEQPTVSEEEERTATTERPSVGSTLLTETTTASKSVITDKTTSRLPVDVTTPVRIFDESPTTVGDESKSTLEATTSKTPIPGQEDTELTSEISLTTSTGSVLERTAMTTESKIRLDATTGKEEQPSTSAVTQQDEAKLDVTTPEDHSIVTTAHLSTTQAAATSTLVEEVPSVEHTTEEREGTTTAQPLETASPSKGIPTLAEEVTTAVKAETDEDKTIATEMSEMETDGVKVSETTRMAETSGATEEVSSVEHTTAERKETTTTQTTKVATTFKVAEDSEASSLGTEATTPEAAETDDGQNITSEIIKTETESVKVTETAKASAETSTVTTEVSSVERTTAEIKETATASTLRVTTPSKGTEPSTLAEEVTTEVPVETDEDKTVTTGKSTTEKEDVKVSAITRAVETSTVTDEVSSVELTTTRTRETTQTSRSTSPFKVIQDTEASSLADKITTPVEEQTDEAKTVSIEIGETETESVEVTEGTRTVDLSTVSDEVSSVEHKTTERKETTTTQTTRKTSPFKGTEDTEASTLAEEATTLQSVEDITTGKASTETEDVKVSGTTRVIETSTVTDEVSSLRHTTAERKETTTAETQRITSLSTKVTEVSTLAEKAVTPVAEEIGKETETATTEMVETESEGIKVSDESTVQPKAETTTDALKRDTSDTSIMADATQTLTRTTEKVEDDIGEITEFQRTSTSVPEIVTDGLGATSQKPKDVTALDHSTEREDTVATDTVNQTEVSSSKSTPSSAEPTESVTSKVITTTPGLLPETAETEGAMEETSTQLLMMDTGKPKEATVSEGTTDGQTKTVPADTLIKTTTTIDLTDTEKPTEKPAIMRTTKKLTDHTIEMMATSKPVDDHIDDLESATVTSAAPQTVETETDQQELMTESDVHSTESTESEHVTGTEKEQAPTVDAFTSSLGVMTTLQEVSTHTDTETPLSHVTAVDTTTKVSTATPERDITKLPLSSLSTEVTDSAKTTTGKEALETTSRTSETLTKTTAGIEEITTTPAAGSSPTVLEITTADVALSKKETGTPSSGAGTTKQSLVGRKGEPSETPEQSTIEAVTEISQPTTGPTISTHILSETSMLETTSTTLREKTVPESTVSVSTTPKTTAVQDFTTEPVDQTTRSTDASILMQSVDLETTGRTAASSKTQATSIFTDIGHTEEVSTGLSEEDVATKTTQVTKTDIPTSSVTTAEMSDETSRSDVSSKMATEATTSFVMPETGTTPKELLSRVPTTVTASVTDGTSSHEITEAKTSSAPMTEPIGSTIKLLDVTETTDDTKSTEAITRRVDEKATTFDEIKTETSVSGTQTPSETSSVPTNVSMSETMPPPVSTLSIKQTTPSVQPDDVTSSIDQSTVEGTKASKDVSKDFSDSTGASVTSALSDEAREPAVTKDSAQETSTAAKEKSVESQDVTTESSTAKSEEEAMMTSTLSSTTKPELTESEFPVESTTELREPVTEQAVTETSVTNVTEFSSEKTVKTTTIPTSPSSHKEFVADVTTLKDGEPSTPDFTTVTTKSAVPTKAERTETTEEAIISTTGVPAGRFTTMSRTEGEKETTPRMAQDVTVSASREDSTTVESISEAEHLVTTTPNDTHVPISSTTRLPDSSSTPISSIGTRPQEFTSTTEAGTSVTDAPHVVVTETSDIPKHTGIGIGERRLDMPKTTPSKALRAETVVETLSSEGFSETDKQPQPSSIPTEPAMNMSVLSTTTMSSILKSNITLPITSMFPKFTSVTLHTGTSDRVPPSGDTVLPQTTQKDKTTAIKPEKSSTTTQIPHASTGVIDTTTMLDTTQSQNTSIHDEDVTLSDAEDEDVFLDEGACVLEGRVYQSAEQIPRPDPCEFCFCFRGDIICLQQSCPPPLMGCHQTPIPGYCCPRYECPILVTSRNITKVGRRGQTRPPVYIQRHIQKRHIRPTIEVKGCEVNGTFYEIGETVRSASGPCLHCQCDGDGMMRCDPQKCKPQPPLLLKMNKNMTRRKR